MNVFIFLKLMNISIFMLVILQVYTFHINQNRRFDNRMKFTINTFEDISLNQCIFECKKRARCLAVEYRKLVKYCSLQSENETLVKDAGYIVVQGIDEKIQCEMVHCLKNEVCEIESRTCHLFECGYPDFDHTDIKGNMFRVGAKLGSSCPSFKQYSCNTTGQWERKEQINYPGKRPHLKTIVPKCKSKDICAALTCREIRGLDSNAQSGYYKNSLGTIIFCDFDTDGGDWMVFQRRLDGSVDFYRTWEYYKSGFGNICGEFWLGLENIYDILQLSSSEFELRVDLEDWEGNTAYASYDTFSITGESDEYRLNIGNYTGNACDSLIFHNGHQFSTKDRGDKTRCAIRYIGAWWYNVCHRSNLNGFYYPSRIVTLDASGICWYYWKNTFNYSMKAVSMKFREKRWTYF